METPHIRPWRLLTLGNGNSSHLAVESFHIFNNWLNKNKKISKAKNEALKE